MAGLSAFKKSTEPLTASESLLNFDNPGVMFFNGKKYAVNMLWLTMDESGLNFDDRNNILKARKALIAPDFSADRSVVISQQGYGHLEKNHRLGMPVAAATAADLLVGEWHGCFRAENGWWYVAVHGDAIAPDGDKFFRSEEEAYTHFTGAMERQHWPRAYAPEEWGIKGTSSEITLDKLLSGIQSSFLRPLNLDAIFGNTQNKFLFFLAVGFIAFLGLTFISTGLDQYAEPIAPLQKPTAIQVADPLVIPPRYVSGFFADPTAMLEISDFSAPALMRRCLEGFEELYASLPGWTLQKITCSSGNVGGEWSRASAKLADLNSLRPRFPQDVDMTFDGNSKLLVTRPLSLEGIEKGRMQILRKELLFATLTTRLESKGMLNISQVQQATQQAIDPNTGLPVTTGPQERYMSVDFKSPLSAYLWAEDFDIPGMKPLELTWSIPDSTWSLTGLVQYQ